jgi:ATP-binding cassette subfamily F protein 3
MIDFQNVSLGYGGQEVLVDVSFRIGAGDRVGIVGPNGTGKTTLFSLLTGELTSDKGSISVPRDLKTGYLRQQLVPHTVSDSLLDYVENALSTVRTIQHEIEALEASLPSIEGKERERGLKRLGHLQTEFENLGGYELSTRAQEALGGLGFSTNEFHQPFQSFSGGWQMRAELARALVARPDLLLLDEPTNFLDIPAVEWLQRFLREYRGTLLLISHDRYMLNTLTTVTLEVLGGRVTRYGGNYDYYVRERRSRHEQLEAAKKNQDRRREQVERFIERFRAKNTKSSAVQSRVKMLEKLEEIDIPSVALPRARIRMAKPPHCGAEVMRLEGAGVTYDSQRWVLRGLDLRVDRGEKTALVGLNGMGKTTLLRVLAGILPLSEGRRIVGHKVVPGYQAQDFGEMMSPDRTVFETVKAVSPGSTEREIRTLLGGFLFSGDAVEKTVSVLSGGEKMRLAFARLLLNPPNFILLDEPTTHLDITARETLENALQTYEGTLFLVSHDIEFVRHVATSIIAMTPPIVSRCPGNYDYYREKIARDQDAALPQPLPAAGETKVADRKALRREKAVRRQELGRLKRPHEEAIRRAEVEIASLEKEQAALVESLSTPSPTTDFAGINRRLSQIKYELSIVADRWEKSSLALEELLKKDP